MELGAKNPAPAAEGSHWDFEWRLHSDMSQKRG